MKAQMDKIGRLVRRVIQLTLLMILTRLVLWLTEVARRDCLVGWDNPSLCKEWLEFQHAWYKLDDYVELKQLELDLGL